MAFTLKEEQALLQAIRDPEVDQQTKQDALGIIDPEYRTLAPEVQARILKEVQGIPFQPKPQEGPQEPLQATQPTEQPALPTRINDAIVGAAKALGEEALGVLQLPWAMARKGLTVAGVDPDEPRPPLFTVVQPRPPSIPPVLDRFGQEVAPVPLSPLGEQVGDLLGFAMPWSGLKAGAQAGGKIAESLLRRTPTIAPVVEPLVPTALSPGRSGRLFDLATEATSPSSSAILEQVAPTSVAGLARREQLASVAPSEFLIQPQGFKQVPGSGSTGTYLLEGSPGAPLRPGFLQSAEQRIEAGKRIPTAEDLLRQRFEERAASGSLTRNFGAELEPVAEQARAKALGIPPNPTQAILGQAPRITQPQAAGLSKAIEDTRKLTPPTADLAPKNVVGISDAGKPYVLPSGFNRMFSAALDVLGEVGPLGQTAKKVLWQYMDKVERETSHVMMNFDEKVARILQRVDPATREVVVEGRRDWLSQKAARHFNPLNDYRMEHLYQLGKEDVNQLVDMLETHGRMKPTGEQAPVIEELANAFFAATKTTSDNAGVHLFTVPDPLVPGGQRAYGSANMFFPHLPKGDKLGQLADLRVKQLYAVAKKQRGFTGTLDDYKAQLTLLTKVREREVEAGAFGWLGKAREMPDLSDLGRPSAVLDALGYNTDPMQVLFAFTSHGRRGGEAKLIEPQVRELVAGIKSKLEDPDARVWVDTLAERVIGKPPLEHIDLAVRNYLTDLRHLNDLTLLQGFGVSPAAVSQMNQLTYILGRAGYVNTAQAAASSLRGTHELGPLGKVLDMSGIEKLSPAEANRSGAMFTTLLNEFTVPTTRLGRLATGSLRASGFTAADAEMRQFGATVGAHWADKMAKVLVAHPQNAKARGIMQELQLDPDAVIKAGGLTQDMRETAAQNFANMTSGRTDVRTLPLWATKNDPVAQLFYQYKKFLFNNAIEFKRQVLNSEVPTSTKLARTGRLLGSAAVIGEVTREMQLAISHLQNPFEIKGEKRVAAPLRGIYKDSPAAAYAIDRMIFGLGSVYGLLLYSAMETSETALYETIFGPTAGLGVDIVTGVNKGIQGTVGGQEKAFHPLVRTIGRRLPVVGPVIPQKLEEYYRSPFEGAPIKPLSGYRTIQPFVTEE